jgi:hypothetical protein
MRKYAFNSNDSASLSVLCVALGVAWAGGCGSDKSESSPDAALPNTPDTALPVPGLDTGTAEDGASAEAAQPQEAGTPTVSYCTSKPALPTVTTVSGTWVIRALATQVVQAPILANPLHPKTLFYMAVKLTQSGSEVVADGHYCDRSEIDEPGSLITVVMPDKWAHTEKPVRRSGSLVVGADGTPVLSFPPLVELAGAVADATTDQLPTDIDDPRVIDEDNDGHRGITINLTGTLNGSLYSVQRQTTAITAIPVAADRFEGLLDFTSEQKVLDSSNELITKLYGQAVAYPDPTRCSSTFAMVKVAGDSGVDAGDAVSCEWVRKNESVLFPQ